MKKFLFIFALIVSFTTVLGYQIIPEQVTIGEQKKPDPSAALELRGAGRGLLINRLTSTERDAIASPATGLVIFNSTANIIEYYNGSGWVPATGGSITEWVSLADYVMNDIVVENSKIYRAADNHTATADFATDYLAGHWELLSGGIKPPIGATDNALVRFDGVTGDVGQNSLAVLDDTGNLSGLQSLVIGGALDTSSIFDVVSTGKGARPCPAMTEVERDAIVSPATSLCIYNTTQGKLNIYNGTLWKAAGGGIENWVTAFSYSVNDVVIESNKIYQCLIAHTSGTFATDLANGDWAELSATGTINLATQVTGVLPIANGGTGSSTKNFVDLSSAQSVAGAKTFSDPVIAGNGLGVSGDSSFSGNISVSGNTTLSTSLTGLIKSVSGVISASPLVDADINPSAAIDYSKLASLSTGQVLLGNAGVPTATTLSGGITVGATGVVTLGNSAVITQLLTGYTSGAGTISSSDSILQAIQKLNGNQLPKTSAVASLDIDWSLVVTGGGLYTKTLSANSTFTFSNKRAGQVITTRITNTASNYTVTWPTVKWSGGTAPVQTVGAKSDVCTFVFDGVDVFGSCVQNF